MCCISYPAWLGRCCGWWWFDSGWLRLFFLTFFERIFRVNGTGTPGPWALRHNKSIRGIETGCNPFLQALKEWGGGGLEPSQKQNISYNLQTDTERFFHDFRNFAAWFRCFSGFFPPHDFETLIVTSWFLKQFFYVFLVVLLPFLIIKEFHTFLHGVVYRHAELGKKKSFSDMFVNITKFTYSEFE